MSSKITKRMMSNVDAMVSRASAATKRTGAATSKRKAAKRALLAAPSKRSGKGSSRATAAKSGSSTSGVSKKARNSGRPKVGLLEQARRELRGTSLVARNVSLLSYSRRQGGGSKKGDSKSRVAVEHLLQLDESKRATTRKSNL